MEWSLQYIVSSRIFTVYCGFNPYFHGVVAAIKHLPAPLWIDYKFQSLFSWSGRCNIDTSTYFWISSFNPYFHGVVAAIYHYEVL